MSDAAGQSTYASLLELLECPVCLETCRPPIYQCLIGHHICSKCHGVKSCPVCRTTGPLDSRCFTLEKMSALLLSPCKFKSSGCQVEQSVADLEEHQKVCEFRCRCPLASCKWFGTKTELLNHFMETANHPLLLDNSAQNPHVNTYDYSKTVNYVLLSEFQQDFFMMRFQYNEEESRLYIYSRYVGPQEGARMFKCNITVYSPDMTRSLKYISQVLNAKECYKKRGNCLQMSLMDANRLTENAGKLIVTRFIEKAYNMYN